MLNGKCPEIPTLPQDCRDAYKKDGDLGLARLVADGLLDHFSPQTCYATKPEMLIVYENKPFEDRLEFDRKYPDWRKKSGVEDYIAERRRVELHNSSCLHWLCIYADLLKDDKERSEKVGAKIAEYGAPKEAQNIADKFGGKVVGWDD